MKPRRVVLDACVLFPTVMREILLGAAATGAYQPIWSPRLLEEWARATRRLPEGAEVIARGEIAVMRKDWPEAEMHDVPPAPDTLSLPDDNDRHVVATAIAACAPIIVTANRKDFPRRALAPFGISVRGPDDFLLELHLDQDLTDVAKAVQARAEAASGRSQPLRPLLKRARLPRLAKLLDAENAR